MTYPDEPINLENNLDVTWGTTIGLKWAEGLHNGGTPVIDYTVFSKDSVVLEWIERQIGVVGTAVTLSSFNPGVTYTFRVKSRSAFDFSVAYSNEVSILAASNPAQPAAPTTQVSGLNVIIDWTPAPDDNGSPITSYKVFIRQNNLIYSEELVNCNGSLADVMVPTQCSVPISVLTASPFSLPYGSNIYA